jgi:hypothetical protein
MNEDYKFYTDLISQGESEKIEFKTRLINEQIIASVVTAFANTNGGYLFIGIGDKGEIIGLSDEELSITNDRIIKICNSIFNYPFSTNIVDFNGKKIVVVKIDKAPEYLSPISTGKGEIFIKKGESVIKTTLKTKTFSIDSDKTEKKREIIGFVAMSFRDEEEPALIDYYNAIQRAAQRTELPIRLTRIDLKEGDFEISQQIMTEIESVNFVISDFTLSPHNVYFEIGFARGVKKRIIQTARKGTNLQFDVRNWNTIFYRNATELEEKLIPKLKEVYTEMIK